MLLFAITGLIVLILILSLHYTQHFQFHFKKCCRRSTQMIKSSDTASNTFQKQMEFIKSSDNTTSCCCELRGREDFDFFPMSFLFYVSFLTSLCFLIIIVQCLDYNYKDNTFINLYHNNSLLEMHKVKVVYILDYILIYAIMILSVWVSLFSFYRYYTTRMSTKKLQHVSTKKVFSKFAIYAFIFCILFMIQIHLYYWVYPIVIILFGVFNFYCSFKFAAMLIKQYKLFIELKCIAMDAKDMLKSSILSKKISLTCCILQSINLSLFMIIYNVNIIYYLPILWSISSFVLAMNFARNRLYMQQKLQNCKRICFSNVLSDNNKETITTDEFIEIVVRNKQNKSKQTRERVNSQSLCDLYNNNKTEALHRTHSEPVHDHDTKLDLNTISTESDDSNIDSSINSAPKLGLKKDKDSKSLDIYMYNDIKPIFLVSAYSDPISSSNKLQSKVHGKKKKSVAPMLSTDNSNKLRALSVLSRLSSISLSNTGHIKSMYHNMDDSTPEPQPASPLPLHFNVTPLVDNDETAINDTRDTNVEQYDDAAADDDDDAGFSILSGFEDEDDDKRNAVVFGIESNIVIGTCHELNLMHHARSNSLPTNMDDIFESFNILAKCGFYSTNNLQKIHKYQKRVSKMKIAKAATPQ